MVSASSAAARRASDLGQNVVVEGDGLCALVGEGLCGIDGGLQLVHSVAHGVGVSRQAGQCLRLAADAQALADGQLGAAVLATSLM